jgi:Ni/Fe-hydrogenase subunit HybB-like protein
MTTYVETRPLIGVRPRIFTRAYNVLLFLAAVSIALIAWRFAVGLGRSTALSDGYPWGIWIAFDVVTGTAFACGGYALAILVYILNKGKYHPLVRPAVLTSALGYSIAGFSVMVDVGRPWAAWRLIKVWTWNLNSVLLEVAVCIMAYTVVLWIELAPAFLAKWKHPIAATITKILDKSLIWILALGMLLPTMHQSSLGSLMMIAGPRLNPLWNTGWLPLFYLITCVAMGYAIVVTEAAYSSAVFNRKPEFSLLKPLGKIAGSLGLLFVLLRFIDLGIKGRLGLVGQFDLSGILFWIETALFVIPFFMLLGKRQSLGSLLRAAMLVAIAGGLYRFDTFLVAFNPGQGWHYFPSVTEQLITVGLVAGELAIYGAVVKYFPILSGTEGERA